MSDVRACARAICLMSTHCHEVITDVRGEYPRFLQTFHRHLALCTKAYRGWPEEVFNSAQHEVDMYRRFSDEYGYAFYVLRPAED
jgi:hypothetical protein